jgi:CBS domain containing-hemolysin-like protein
LNRELGKWLQEFLRFLVRRGTVTEEDIHSIIDAGEEEGVLNLDEHEMIHGVLALKGRIAREIMIPRTEISCVNSQVTVEEVIQRIIEDGHSRIPVFEEDLDHIVGIIYAKDILKFWERRESRTSLREIARKGYFIPQTMNLESLLREFKRKKVHIAIVVDEYGGTSGLITIEDLIEEVFGEIEDEYDMEEERLIPMKDGWVLADGRLEIEELEEHLNIEISEKDFESVGGFIFHLIGRVPKQGEVIDYPGLEIRIEAADDRKVEKVRIRKAPDETKAHLGEPEGSDAE